MDWLIENWVLVLFGGGMIAMHLFGHGHGGHGRKHEGHNPDHTPENPDQTDEAPPTDSTK